LKFESGVGRKAEGEGISREDAKVIIFKKIQTGSFFLGLRWLDTALDFPISALYSHPKLRQAGALQDTLISRKRLGQLRNSIPNPPRLRVRFRTLLSWTAVA
jgi:hypothetical protein